MIALGLILFLGVAGLAYGITSEYVLTDGTHLNASDGPEVTLEDDVDLTTEQPFPDSNTVDLYPHGSVSSDGSTEASVSGLDEEFTSFDQLSVDGTPLEIGLDEKK
ncbi:hypothetical protein EL22_25260 [Halostagnicola sp. A56]|nr:hypothetical protein EL22_25260 [Halostagnicola sp. A56]